MAVSGKSWSKPIQIFRIVASPSDIGANNLPISSVHLLADLEMLRVQLRKEEATELKEHGGEKEPARDALDEGSSICSTPVTEEIDDELEGEKDAE